MTKSRFCIAAATALLATLPASAQAQGLPLPSLTIVSGNDQTVEISHGQASFAPLTVKLLDSAGHPMANQSMFYQCWLGTDCVFPNGSVGITVATDANGVATTPMRGHVNDPDGEGLVVKVGVSGISPAVDFHLMMVPPPVIGIISGNNQSVVHVNLPMPPMTHPWSARFAPLAITVTRSGKPLGGATVTWTCSSPATVMCMGWLSGKGASATTQTDASGATSYTPPVSGMPKGAVGGALTMTATIGSTATSFSLTVR